MNLKTHTAYPEIITGFKTEGDKGYTVWSAKMYQPAEQDPKRKPTDVLKPDVIVEEGTGQIEGQTHVEIAEAKKQAKEFLKPLKAKYARKSEG